MKGSITVFLALSLSCLTGLVLLLTGNAVRNANKIRLEGAVDMAMNSALGEFHPKLHERYGLLYIDLTYHNKEPLVTNLEERLEFYARQNQNSKRKNNPWGSFEVTDFKIAEIKTAAQGNGNSMKRQAISYRCDSGKEREVIFGGAARKVFIRESNNVMQDWTALMTHIKEMELPVITDEQGKREKVFLENPADSTYALADCDLLYLVGMDIDNIGIGAIQRESYISERIKQSSETELLQNADTKIFIEYLFEKMGNYGRIKQDSFLQYQLEYIAIGQRSDYENIKGVVEKLFTHRFTENVQYALSDEKLCKEALNMADGIQVVALDASFREPVAQSILYAAAYLESLSEIQCLLSGGKIQPDKTTWHTGLQQIVSADKCKIDSCFEGYKYEEYLFCLILQLPENVRNLRSMDVMEMDIRYLTGNINFAMDCCVERFTAHIQAVCNRSDSYYLARTYGYY